MVANKKSDKVFQILRLRHCFQNAAEGPFHSCTIKRTNLSKNQLEPSSLRDLLVKIDQQVSSWQYPGIRTSQGTFFRNSKTKKSLEMPDLSPSMRPSATNNLNRLDSTTSHGNYHERHLVIIPDWNSPSEMIIVNDEKGEADVNMEKSTEYDLNVITAGVNRQDAATEPTT